MEQISADKIKKEIRGMLDFGYTEEKILITLISEKGYGNNSQDFKTIIQELRQEKKSKALKSSFIFITIGVILIFISLVTWGISFYRYSTSYYHYYTEYYYFGGLIIGPFLIVVGALKIKDEKQRK